MQSANQLISFPEVTFLRELPARILVRIASPPNQHLIQLARRITIGNAGGSMMSEILAASRIQPAAPPDHICPAP